MEYRNLHLHGGVRSISRLCFGCEPLGGTDWGEVDIEGIKLALASSLELGWNFVDTAAIYGLGASERNVGEIVETKASSVVVATKIGIAQIGPLNGDGRATVVRTLDPTLLDDQIRSSLARLQTNHLPLVYLHYPDKNCDPAAVTQVVGSWIERGVVGGYGLSNFALDDIKKYHGLFPVSAVQFECSMLDPERHGEVRQMVEWCRTNHVLTVAYGVLKKGLLSGKYGLPQPAFDRSDRRSRLDIFKGEKYSQYVGRIERIKALLRDADYDDHQLPAVAIRFILDALDIDVAIVGIKSETQVLGNDQSSRFRLKDDEIAALKLTLGW